MLSSAWSPAVTANVQAWQKGIGRRRSQTVCGSVGRVLAMSINRQRVRAGSGQKARSGNKPRSDTRKLYSMEAQNARNLQ